MKSRPRLQLWSILIESPVASQAVLWLLKALGLDHSGAAVIHIGDDISDEGAFRVLRHRGNGIGIRVAASAWETHAPFFLRDCNEVHAFLRILLEMLRKSDTEDTAQH